MIEFLDTQSLPFKPEFHRLVCGFFFRSGIFCCFWERGEELVLEQALVWKSINLVGGVCFAFLAQWSFGIVLEPFE